MRNLQTLKKKKKTREGEERAAKCEGGWGNGQPFGYLKGSKFAPLHCGVRLYVVAKHRNAAA